jgi:hypothetical protein
MSKLAFPKVGTTRKRAQLEEGSYSHLTLLSNLCTKTHSQPRLQQQYELACESANVFCKHHEHLQRSSESDALRNQEGLQSRQIMLRFFFGLLHCMLLGANFKPCH